MICLWVALIFYIYIQDSNFISLVYMNMTGVTYECNFPFLFLSINYFKILSTKISGSKNVKIYHEHDFKKINL